MRRIAGIVLAAGGSTRLGEPKQLLNLTGEILVHAAVRAAQEGGCDPVCVVTGSSSAAVEIVVADLGPLFALNEEWQRGMGSSIRNGLAAVSSASAVVLLACDQPAVDRTVVQALLELQHCTGKAIVASEYAGTLGIPALFDRTCFPELASLRDDAGAKSVILADPSRVAIATFPGGAHDLDSPGDLARWQTRARDLAEPVPSLDHGP